MNAFLEIHWREPRRERIVRRMMVLSFVAHIAAFGLGSAISPLFPALRISPPVFVELTDAPMSELAEEPPAPPLRMTPPAQAESAATSPRASVSSRRVAREDTAARRWLDRLDAGIRDVPEAPVARREGKAGGIPVRRWSNEGPPRPGDFAPAVAPEGTAALGRHMEELEGRVRRSGRPAVGTGKETEASMMFGGTGDSAGEPIPPWIRDMIRRRVRGFLPELEETYTAAIRRNPDLQGKLLVRFRIDPSGKIQRAEPAGDHSLDDAFVNAVLDKVRRWTFEPTGGRAVEVLYPFLFSAPS